MDILPTSFVPASRFPLKWIELICWKSYTIWLPCDEIVKCFRLHEISMMENRTANQDIKNNVYCKQKWLSRFVHRKKRENGRFETRELNDLFT